MKFRIIVALTWLAAGRAMTLAFIARAGGGGPGDPPSVWLMPLVGDAVVGVAAIVIAVLLMKRNTPGVWLGAVVWNAVAAFDALAAFLVHSVVPWNDFFMLRLLGPAMFFGAAAMHLLLLWLLLDRDVRRRFGVELSPATP